MPLPLIVTKANRKIINPVARTFAGRVPPFAIIEHHGRKSGKPFRTPIMVFQAGDDLIFALTYGPETDWVKNVLAEGGCTIEYGRKLVALTDPRLSHGSPNDQPLPFIVRSILQVARVSDFLRVRRS